ncbi:MAG TPA: branched-chain amino acid ABC transporter permease [Anaeromyxobacteraceae bacterium]|nr:branched-chain amino acid ABC transporter permease [Anaeromyxobacteraceae bacterium]
MSPADPAPPPSRARAVLGGFVPFAVALALLGALQPVLPPTATIVLLNAGVNVILAVSLNVVNGFTGQFSLGHAGFMAVGAYASARVTLAFADVQLSFLPGVLSDQVVFALALVVAMAAAGLAGFLVGAPSLRLRGDYLAIVTLGFGEIIRSIIENVGWLGGALGLSGLPRLTNLTWVGLGVVATSLMARRLAASTQGRALFAIREDEIAAEAMGVDTTGYKIRAFAISAAYAGLAGALSVHLIQLATPSSFTFIRSIEVVVIVVLGGLGSITGSILTALGLTVGLELLRDVQQYRMVVYALLLVVLMLARPQGIFGSRELWDLWRSRPPPPFPTGGGGKGEGAP